MLRTNGPNTDPKRSSRPLASPSCLTYTDNPLFLNLIPKEKGRAKKKNSYWLTYDLRSHLQDGRWFGGIKEKAHYRLEGCGRVPRGVRTIDKRGYWRTDYAEQGWSYNTETKTGKRLGTIRCGLAICPFCSAHSERVRVKETSELLTHFAKEGKHFITATFTAPNNLDAETQLDGFIKTQDKVFSGHYLKRLRDEYSYEGMIRDIDYTANIETETHHFHLPVVMVFDQLTPQLQVKLEDELFLRWRKFAKKSGLGTPTKSAFYFDAVRSIEGTAVYNAAKLGATAKKLNLALELHASHTKTAQKSGMNPWELLATARPKNKSARLFNGYARAIEGRQMNGARGKLRDQLKIIRERPEETPEETNEDLKEQIKEIICSARLAQEVQKRFSTKDWVRRLASDPIFAERVETLAELEQELNVFESAEFLKFAVGYVWIFASKESNGSWSRRIRKEIREAEQKLDREVDDLWVGL